MYSTDAEIKIVFEGCNYLVAEEEWREAVLHFSDLVKAFYDASRPKNSETWQEETRDGYAAFVAEWDRRVKAAKAGYQD